MAKQISTVCDTQGVPILELVKEEDTISVFEADDMDPRIKFPAAAIATLISLLEKFK
ncbi:MAG: hypothetical protein P4M04_05850 [Acidobacteriota bacterium]|nr:hypothetical protein [Acidobacteriota bacterium]